MERTSAVAAGEYKERRGGSTMKKSGNSQCLRTSFQAGTLLAAGVFTGQIAMAQTATGLVQGAAAPAASAATPVGISSELSEIVVTGTNRHQHRAADHPDIVCGHGDRPGGP
jgi:hypothetical protein